MIKYMKSLKMIIVSTIKIALLENNSLIIIENAIMTYDKFKKDKNFTIELTDKIIDDFKLIDLSIIEHAIL